ncbi:protein FAM217B-like [Brachionichthys hirsutus]|uniref:protein FAM217B-like n=1 Tax=Brachionichthys hirsutus TaxID=412623 RepID=UPI00360446C1
MGTILQEREPQQHPGRVSITGPEWKKKKASWNSSRPDVDSVQGLSESGPVHPVKDRKEVQAHPPAQRCSRGEHQLTPFRENKDAPALPCFALTDSRPDLLDGISSIGSLSSHGESDSDTDLSESERLPVLRTGGVLPQLELRPEVIKPEEASSRSHRPRGRSHGGFDFPDFLPPPFNSWSLSQLAVFYDTEGRGASRPRPTGPLERYLERLLQMEWHQIQTCQEKNGKSDVTTGCHRSSASASSRLSSPKRILRCQRAFPFTFLSSLASHSVPLPGCACASCCSRYTTRSKTSCRSTHTHTRQSGLGPLMLHRGPGSLPKRSYSESRVRSSDRRSASQTQRPHSPVRTASHLRRMQASGNIRNLVQDANAKPLSAARDASAGATGDCFPWRGDVLDYRTGGFRRRSGSEQRTGRLERRGALEKRQSGSECKRGGGGADQRRAAEIKEQEIKPDAVTAIMDNLPGSKDSPVNRLSKVKQVEFVTSANLCAATRRRV